jgi:hypothetical protein
MEEANATMANGIAQFCLTEEWADVHFHVVVRLSDGEEEEEVETEVLFHSSILRFPWATIKFV